MAASYAKYVGALQDTQAGSGATLAGSPAIFYWYYEGATINGNPNAPNLVSPRDAIGQFFNWFQSRGCMPDPTAASCTVPLGGPPSISGVNIQIRDALKSPYTNEYVLGLSGAIGPRGSFRADFVRREYGNFYDLNKGIDNGKVPSPVNPAQLYDLGLIENSNDYTRNYTGLHTQFAYRVGERFSLGGNWTWSHLIGDLVGETSGSSVTSAAASTPTRSISTASGTRPSAASGATRVTASASTETTTFRSRRRSALSTSASSRAGTPAPPTALSEPSGRAPT